MHIRKTKNPLVVLLLVLLGIGLLLNPLHWMFPLGFHPTTAGNSGPVDLPRNNLQTECPICLLVRHSSQLVFPFLLVGIVLSLNVSGSYFSNWIENLHSKWFDSAFFARPPPVNPSL